MKGNETALERAAFLLHDVFEAGYGEIAQALGKSEDATRQIVHRAREHVRRDRPRFQIRRELGLPIGRWIRILDQRLRHPRADVGFALDACGAQAVDAKTRERRDPPCFGHWMDSTLAWCQRRQVSWSMSSASAFEPSMR